MHFFQKIAKWVFGLATVALGVNLGYAVFAKDLPLAHVKRNLSYAEDVGLALFYFILAILIFLALNFGRRLFNRTNLFRLILSGVSLVLALVVFDLALMPFNLVFNAGRAMQFDFEDMKKSAHQNPQRKNTLEAKARWVGRDPQLGYIPLMGEQYNYSELGALHNEYPAEKPLGKTRVLFTGDSISAQAYLTEETKALYPKPEYEYWTTGVYGYSTFQEVRYFERYGRKLKPDVVILEFCLNDWDGTPVILEDDKGFTIIANMYLGQEQFNYWLFKNSTLYRVYLSLLASFSERAGLKLDVETHLKKLKEYSEKDGFALRVVVYPELAKLKEWPEKFKNQRADIIEILKRLQIPYYDAAPLLDRALKKHPRDWARFKPDDHFHPSRNFTRMISRQIIKRGFLDPPKTN